MPGLLTRGESVFRLVLHPQIDIVGASRSLIETAMKHLTAAMILVSVFASTSLLHAQTFQTLCSFNGTNGLYPNGLTLGNDGNFYGTTSYGGISNYGTVFQVTPGGTLTTLVSFNYTNGTYPYSVLTLGNDGSFYGTTTQGGKVTPVFPSGMGTLFTVKTDGTLTTLVAFDLTNGSGPGGALTWGNDGSLYGTSSKGGNGPGLSDGTFFQVTTNGVLTPLAYFHGSNGAYPSAVTLGNDGNFYGTTSDSGSGYGTYGTVFRVTTNGILNTLFSFSYTNGMGVEPGAPLTLGNDGNFYGTTTLGGNIGLHSGDGWGTVFKVTMSGNLTTLHSFNYTNDGGSPSAALLLGSDGNFYGTTSIGGSGGYGTVFEITPSGTLTTLVSFDGSNGDNPSALTVGPDGNLYGVTFYGGSDEGTVFRLMLPPVVITPPQNQTNSAGTTASFTVIASSLNPLGYQWQKNGTNLVDGGNISGSTTNTLTITDVSDSDAALYAVIVSNPNANITNYAALTVIAPPVIVAQPTNQLTLPGTNISFGISLTGSAPLHYQWLFNGTNLLNATNVAYTISTVATNNAGNYSVVVTNSAGGAVSSNAALTVVLSPANRTNYAGSTAVFAATVFSPKALTFQWQKNGTNLVDGGNVSGSTANSLTITDVSDSDAAVYAVIVSNPNASITNYATLTVIDPPIIVVQPKNQMALPGTNISFGISLTGSAPFRYQWLFNGTNLLHATNATYAISAVATNNAGNYSVVVTNSAGSAVGSNAALTVVLSPANRTNHAGSTAVFAAMVFSPEALNFKWQRNGTNLMDGGNVSGSTNVSLAIANVSDADAATYNLVVSDATGSVTTSNALLTVNDLPLFATQPQSQTVLPGSNVTFTASAYGASPLVFQWYFNGSQIGSPMSGTNFTSYAVNNVGSNQMGNYSVQAINAYGSVMSSNAALTVVLLPFITAQPKSQTNAANSTATFSVTVSSLSTLSYQWQENGTNLVNSGKYSGVTNSTLTITAVSSNEAAVYSVAVTNLAGSVVSSNAILTVIYPPVITAQPLGQRLVSGNSITFNVGVGGTAPFSYQWRFNTGNLLNATNATYTIAPAGTNNTGNYSVVVANLAGSATSSNALLVVLVPPWLALELADGYPLLSLNGMLSNNFTVQYATNLTDTNWTTLLSLTNLLTSPYEFLDPAGIVPPSRFYRAVME